MNRKQRYTSDCVDGPTTLFGPVPSRRLGRSLGIDVIPPKTCTYDCVYCESGPTTHLTIRRQAFVEPERVVRDLELFFRSHPSGADVLTFSGAGEPLLYEPLEELVGAIKKRFGSLPLVMITNGALLYDRVVRRALQKVDVVMPSLDAASSEIFKVLNRPHPDLELEIIVEGLKAFRKDYRGQINLEVLLVRGRNDQPDHLRRLNDIIAEIKPDKVELNTVVRPPAAPEVRGLEIHEMEQALGHFNGQKVNIIGCFTCGAACESDLTLPERIVRLIKRRPCTEKEMAESLAVKAEDLAAALTKLERRNVIIRRPFGNKFYICLPDR